MLHISFSGSWTSTQHGSTYYTDVQLQPLFAHVDETCISWRSWSDVFNVWQITGDISMLDFYSSFRMNANDVSLRLEQHCARTEGRSFFKSLRFPSDRGFTKSRWRSINSGSARTANVITTQFNKGRRLSSVTEGKQIITHLLMGWDIRIRIKQATKVSSPPDSIPVILLRWSLFFPFTIVLVCVFFACWGFVSLCRTVLPLLVWGAKQLGPELQPGLPVWLHQFVQFSVEWIIPVFQVIEIVVDLI